MLEALVIIVSLGGLEVALWWADRKRQADQLATLEAIWVELALLNEGRHAEQLPEPLARAVDLPLPAVPTPTIVAQ